MSHPQGHPGAAAEPDSQGTEVPHAGTARFPKKYQHTGEELF